MMIDIEKPVAFANPNRANYLKVSGPDIKYRTTLYEKCQVSTHIWEWDNFLIITDINGKCIKLINHAGNNGTSEQSILQLYNLINSPTDIWTNLYWIEDSNGKNFRITNFGYFDSYEKAKNMAIKNPRYYCTVNINTIKEMNNGKA